MPLPFLLFLASDPDELDGVDAPVSVLAALSWLWLGEEEGSGLRLRAAPIPESESLSLELLLELLLEEEEELEEDEDEEEEELLLEDLLVDFFFALFFAFLLWKTHSKLSALSMARASSPRKGNLRSSCCSHRRAMWCDGRGRVRRTEQRRVADKSEHNKTKTTICTPAAVGKQPHTRARMHVHTMKRTFLATRVFLQTSPKLTRELKFCVTAMESSRLSTACHQPPGSQKKRTTNECEP